MLEPLLGNQVILGGFNRIFLTPHFLIHLSLLAGFWGFFSIFVKPQLKKKRLKKKYLRAFLAYFTAVAATWLLIQIGVMLGFGLSVEPSFIKIQATYLGIFGLSFLTHHFTKKTWLSLLVFICGIILGYLAVLLGADTVMDRLGRYGFEVLGYRFSLASILRTVVTVALFLGLAGFLSNIGNTQIKKIKKINSTTRSLLIKMWDVAIYILAVLIILNIVGVKLTTLTVIGGALGVGIGFGLQKISSNFISGIILLFERSIEVNDLIEVDTIYGFVRHLGARFCLIETFDGKEIFVPNEDLIANRVTNWTYSSSRGRVEIQVGVSYRSDLRLVQQLILEAANDHVECLKDPAPVCYLRNFSDSSVTFLLHFFVEDVAKGRFGIQSDVMFSIWNKFKEHGIEIPFPQRDVTIKNVETLFSQPTLKKGDIPE